MLGIIIIIISIYLDGFLTLFLPYIPGDLSYFTPLLTITSFLLIYPLYRKKERTYFITLLITGLIYDLLYTNLLFYDSIIFILLGYIISLIYKNLDVSNIKIGLYTILLIIVYEVLFYIFIVIFNIVPISLPKLIYKITHSILLNVIYSEIVFLVIDKLPKKYKRIYIN